MKENKQTYISPDTEVVLIEVEQSILAASIEGVGETLPEIEW